jgi:glycosyltransferase involved in cell wall biosynthesis
MRAIPDITIVPVSFGRELPSHRSARRVTRAFIGAVKAMASMARLVLYVRRHAISVIHTSDRPRDAFGCVLLARVTGARCVVQCHVAHREWMGPLLRWALRRPDALIAVSDFVAGTLACAGFDRHRIHVALNAIDASLWRPGLGRDDARRELGIPTTAPVVITVCRLFPAKGPDALIRALASVRAVLPDARLLVVGEDLMGDGAYTRELEALASALGLHEAVIFTGRRTDVARLLAAADVFAMPSLEEPFGLVFLEAMAMRLPVAALNDGGTPEVVRHGETGLLSEPGDVDTFADNLVALLRDPDRRRCMGDRGRREVEEHFTLARMAADVAQAYTAVLGRRRVDLRAEKEREMQTISTDDVRTLVDAIRADGYAVVPGVVPKDRLATFAAMLNEEYQAAKSSGELFKGGGSLSGHLNCFPGVGSRFIYDAVVDRGILDVVREIDAASVSAVRPTLNYNLPKSVTQFYHMDGLYTEPFLICNIAVVDTDLGNGAIDVLPGTHRRFYPYWRYVLERKRRLSTRVCLEQGDVLLRLSTLWHRGMPNTTSSPRPMMSLTFGEHGVPTGDPYLANDGKVEFYPNWYKTNRVGRIRERVYVTLPITDSAFRFARSLVSNKGYSSW